MKRVIVVIDSRAQYGRGCLWGVIRYAQAHQSWDILHLEQETDYDLKTLVSRWSPDGILCQMNRSHVAEQLGELDVPAVSLRAPCTPKGAPWFDTDHETCVRMAIDHLVQNGFPHFGFCGIVDVEFSDARQRVFEQVMRENGIPIHAYSPSLLSSFEDDDEPQRKVHTKLNTPALRDWLSSLPQPIGIVACNDMHAMRVLEAAHEAGLTIPESVAVVGVDNDPMICEMTIPPLTSVEPDTERIGYLGSEMLDRRMARQTISEYQNYIKPRDLVVRHSSDGLAVGDPAIATALRVIRRSAIQGVSVQQVAMESDLSRASLDRRFRQVMGRTPKQEIDRQRLQQSKRLLQETNYPLSKVAMLSGFADASHLCKVFQRGVGKSPEQFRKSALSV
jgi:LacI family transcriptional regulator